MAAIRLEVLPLTLLLASLAGAQWVQQGLGAPRFPLSGSEGPCGYNYPPPMGMTMVQQPVVAQRPSPPVNAPLGTQAVNQQPPAIQPAFDPQAQPAFNPQSPAQQPQQQFLPQSQQGLNQQWLNPGANPMLPQGQGQLSHADRLGLPRGMTVRQAAIMEIDPNNPYDLDVPELNSINPAFDRPATGVGPLGAGGPFNMGAQGIPPAQTNAFNMGANRSPQGQANAFIVGANGSPQGQANAFNVGANGSPQGQANGFNVGANGSPQGQANVFDLRTPQGQTNGFDMRTPQGQTNGFDMGPPQGQAPGAFAPMPAQPQPPFAYRPRLNCQCDRGGDCGPRPTFFGLNFNHHCRLGYVCCCRRA